MTLDTNNRDMHRRLERHHRTDGVLQSRARPVSHKRNDVNGASFAAKVVRDVVHGNVDGQVGSVPVAKRLLGNLLGGSNSDEGTSGESGSGSGVTRSGGRSSNSDDSFEDSSQDTGSPTTSSSSSFSSSSNSGSSSTEGGDEEGTSSNDGSTSSSSNSPSSSSKSSGDSSSGGLLGLPLFSSSSSSSTPRPTSTSSSSSSPATSTSAPTMTSSETPAYSTSIAYVTSSPIPTQSAAPVSSTPQVSDGPGAGPIIGIVAGSLAGVAILAVIVGFLFKKFGKREDPYETNPFGHDDVYRNSTGFPDGYDIDEGYAPSMSEKQVPHEQGYGLGPGNEYGNMPPSATFASKQSFESGRPRPPTMFQRHLDHQANFVPGDEMAPMPAFNPGMHVNGQGYGYQDVSPPLPPMAFMGHHGFDSGAPQFGTLERSGSVAQQYDHFTGQPIAYADLSRGASGKVSSHGHDNGPPVLPALEHPTGLERNGSLQQHDTAGRPGSTEQRSGTPDLPNVQQTYATHRAESTASHDNAQSQTMDQGFAAQFPMPPSQGQYGAQHTGMTLPPYRADEAEFQGGSYAYEKQQQQQPPFHTSPQHQPLQVRNLLARKPAPQQPLGDAPVHGGAQTNDSAYGGVW